MPRRYPAEFRRRVLDLIAEGRPVAEVAADLGISPQVIYNWRKQDLIDRGETSGLTSTDRAELVTMSANPGEAHLDIDVAVVHAADHIELLRQ